MTAERHRTPILAANWKLQHGPAATREYVQRFVQRYAPRDDRTVILAPPAISLTTAADALNNRPDIRLAVQNVWTQPRGAFTGETSAEMAAEAGASVAIVGHSERRHVFGESIAATAAKCTAALAAGLDVILCVGETLEQREAGTTESVVLDQLRGGLAAVGQQDTARIVIAYEPVWAIGTGRTATPDDAAAVHRVIRTALGQLLPGAGEHTPILYGGSVSAANARGLLDADQVSGLLVGGASLDPEGWAAICQT
jgi:triosephosphate isomerase (TIM)